MAVFVNRVRMGGAGLLLVPPSLSGSSLSARISHLVPGLKRIGRDWSLRSAPHDVAPVYRGSDIRGVVRPVEGWRIQRE